MRAQYRHIDLKIKYQYSCESFGLDDLLVPIYNTDHLLTLVFYYVYVL